MGSQGVLAEHVDPHNTDMKDHHIAPKSLGEALRAAGMSMYGSSTGSETPSEEDYDVNVRPSLTEPGVVRRRISPTIETSSNSPAEQKRNVFRRDSGVYIIPDEDNAIQEFLQRSSERAKEPVSRRRPGVFADIVFTRQFSAFDRQNLSSVNSPFHGFFTLFWLGVALFVLKIFANNWRTYGNPLGTNDIMKTMFSREGIRRYPFHKSHNTYKLLVFVLLLSDGFMCGFTGVSWAIQQLVFRRYLDWNRSGWIIQNVSSSPVIKSKHRH